MDCNNLFEIGGGCDLLSWITSMKLLLCHSLVRSAILFNTY